MYKQKTVVVLGAGPAGLMAAWKLQQAGYQVSVVEKEPVAGGMCATQTFSNADGDYRFDYGGHRFITHNPELITFVEELMGDQLLHSSRKSVIRFRGRIYDYPLNLKNLLSTGPFSLLFGAAFDLLIALPLQRLQGKQPDNNFSDWTCARFGKTLYRNFFAGYTEKLWGIKPENLSADWADQRISLLNLKDVVLRMLPGEKSSVRTYADKYRYPREGFGQIYQTLAEKLKQQGVTFHFNAAVVAMNGSHGKVHSVSFDQDGVEHKISAEHIVATLPLPDVSRWLGYDSQLSYRSLRFLNFPVNLPNISDNTWQYLSDPEILGTRLQEPRRRSPYMAPEGKTSAMVEIPCNYEDETWLMPKALLRKRVEQDLLQLGISSECLGEDCFSAYSQHAYPLMEVGYEEKRQQAINHLSQFSNLYMTGRQATFRYIFTDTAMEMGLMTAEAIINNTDNRFDVFNHRNEKTVIETESVA